MTSVRKRLAFAISPSVPTLYLLLMPTILGSEYEDKRVAILVIVLSMLPSYVSCLLVGPAVVRALEKRNALSIVNIMILGAVFGAVAFYLYGFLVAILLDSQQEIFPRLSDILWGAMFGISVSLLFGLIAGIPLANFDKK